MAAGRKTGGRRPGSRNKATLEREAALTAAAQDATAGLTREQIQRMLPREVMLLVMRMALEQGNLALVLAAAKEAAPYIHGKVAPIAPKDGGPDPAEIGDDDDPPTLDRGDG